MTNSDAKRLVEERQNVGMCGTCGFPAVLHGLAALIRSKDESPEHEQLVADMAPYIVNALFSVSEGIKLGRDAVGRARYVVILDTFAECGPCPTFSPGGQWDLGVLRSQPSAMFAYLYDIRHQIFQGGFPRLSRIYNVRYLHLEHWRL